MSASPSTDASGEPPWFPSGWPLPCPRFVGELLFVCLFSNLRQWFSVQSSSAFVSRVPFESRSSPVRVPVPVRPLTFHDTQQCFDSRFSFHFPPQIDFLFGFTSIHTHTHAHRHSHMNTHTPMYVTMVSVVNRQSLNGC